MLREPAGQRRYRWSQMTLHWLVVALIASQYLSSGAIARTHHADDPSRLDLVLHALHNRIGLIILAIMLARLGLRFWYGPSFREGAQSLRERLARAVHAAFYGVVIAQATTGAITSYLFWPMGVVHRSLWLMLAALIIIHVLAALWHHLIARDDTLRRMLPGR